MTHGEHDARTAPTDARTAPPPWHALAVDDVALRLGVDPAAGLTDAEVEIRRRRHGPNLLAESSGRAPLSIFVHQFQSVIVALLLVAAGIALALGETLESAAILTVIVLNALIGFFTEWKAERALSALKKQSAPLAHVLRHGRASPRPAAELVPGDVVLLDAGARVPADGRIFEAVRLQLDEAPLTGESAPVSKRVDPVVDLDAPPGDRLSMAFLGTAVTEGRGRMLVTATGPATEVGRIGALIESAAGRDSPLERQLARLGHALVRIVLGLCLVIVLAGWLRGNDLWHMLEVGISLAIAAVPEGLPAVATMTLALGMQRMARMRALVRRLPAVETLGSTTVICSDKTGTLTKNELTVQALHLADRGITVTGAGYALDGEFHDAAGRRLEPAADSHLALALRIGALCGDAVLTTLDGAPGILGDPTDGALLVAAHKAGLRREDLDRAFPRLAEAPFTHDSKRVVTVHRDPSGNTIAFVKGAPAVVLEACRRRHDVSGPQPLDDDQRLQALEVNRRLAGRALRVLALACKQLPADWRWDDLADDLVFVGLVGMIDPLRDEAVAAIATCRSAGIRTLMITGDQEATAREIGRQLGLDRDPLGRPLGAVHGRDLARLDPAGWREVAARASVFARVSPEHKLRLVEALQAAGEVVAMTGDGVNDAPALRQADIGMAMGVKGSDVAKEAADMVITDDDFATIVAAVEQGRIIYANIVRFIHYLLSCNLSEILVVFLAILFGWPLPLGPLQVLWLNLITDVFPALALALEPSSPEAMKRPPRDPRQPLVHGRFLVLIAWQAALLAGFTLLAFRVALAAPVPADHGPRHAVTVAFMTLALAQVVHAFAARSQHRSAFDARLFTNPWLWVAALACLALQAVAVAWSPLRRILDTTPLAPGDWALVAACSLGPLATIELVKLLGRIRSSAPSPVE